MDRRFQVKLKKKHWWARPAGEIFEGFSHSRNGECTGIVTEEDLPAIRKKAQVNGYRIHVTDTRYIRGKHYRETYFEKAPAIRGRYRCAYCGKLLPEESLTVDHVIPVSAVQKSLLARAYLKMEGAESVNDYENLVGACETCNKSKGSSLSALWVLRAGIGTRPGYWERMHVTTALIALTVVSMLLSAQSGKAGDIGNMLADIIRQADRAAADILVWIWGRIGI